MDYDVPGARQEFGLMPQGLLDVLQSFASSDLGSSVVHFHYPGTSGELSMHCCMAAEMDEGETTQYNFYARIMPVVLEARRDIGDAW